MNGVALNSCLIGNKHYTGKCYLTLLVSGAVFVDHTLSKPPSFFARALKLYVNDPYVHDLSFSLFHTLCVNGVNHKCGSGFRSLFQYLSGSLCLFILVGCLRKM